MARFPVCSSLLRPLLSVPSPTSARTFSTASRLAGYEATLPHLRIGQHTRVVFQGFTGKQATANAKESLEWGTNIVGGVTPGRTGEHLGLPVLPTVRQAMEELKPDATGIYVAAHQAAAAIEEAIEAEVPLIVAVAEHIPLHDILRIHSVLKTQSASRLVGANAPGIISAVGRCRIGFQPLPCFVAGRVGIIAKSGTLSYEAVASTARAGLGQSLCIGVGGDIVAGTDMREALSVLEHDDDTEAIVLIGEIGGFGEIDAAEWIKEYHSRTKDPKPIAALIAGENAVPDRVMGHAGAFAVLGEPSAVDKVRALERVGVTIVDHPEMFGPALVKLLPRKPAPQIRHSHEFGTQRRRLHTLARQLPRRSQASTPVIYLSQRRSIYLAESDAFNLLRQQGVTVTPEESTTSGGKNGVEPSFLAIGIDRSARTPCLIASPSLASGASHPLARHFPFDYRAGVRDLDVAAIATCLALGTGAHASLARLVHNLAHVFYAREAFLLATGVRARLGDVQVVVARFGLDDAAFRTAGRERQPDTAALRDAALAAADNAGEAEAEAEAEAERHGIVYIRLPGAGGARVATLVNGAGLAMNTVDELERLGGRGTAANFLDTGGKATSETVRKSFEIVLRDGRVGAVFVNIFGGLTLGDMIARGVILALEELALTVPVVVRIRGTNEREGQRIIAESGLPLFPFDDFHEAARKAIELARGQV